MKALVTGADGFVGRWLIEHLEASGDEVWQATGRHDGAGPRRRRLDLLDRHSVDQTVAWARPDAVYHLAAVAFGPDAAADIGTALDVTVRGTAFLLEATRAQSPMPDVLIAGSSEVYGAPVRQPIDESMPHEPVNVYGATKLAQEALALAYHHAHGLPVVVARAFNHIGPGQRESFVVPAFAAQLAEIAAGRSEPVIRVGNLDAERDLSDVRDVVRAYRLLVAGGHVGQPVNVASGRSVRIRDVLDRLIAISGLSVAVEVDEALLRRVDVPVICGDVSRLTALTTWQPRHDLDDSLLAIWHDARRRHGLPTTDSDGAEPGATPARSARRTSSTARSGTRDRRG